MIKKNNKLRKAIKLVFRYTLITLGILLVIPFVLALVLMLNPVQNKVVDWVSEYASEQIGSRIEVGTVSFIPFTEFDITNVILLDHRQDTLAYIGELEVEFNAFRTNPLRLSFDRALLDHVVFKMKTYEGDSVSNLQYFLNGLPKSDSDEKTAFQLGLGRLFLLDGRLEIDNANEEVKEKGQIDFNHLMVNGLSGDLKNIHIINDSVSLEICELHLKEKSGFRIKELNTAATIFNGDVICQNLYLYTNTGSVYGDYSMQANAWSAYKDFIHEVRLEADLYNSDIRFNDISYFTPKLKDLLTPFVFNGNVHGTIDNLKADVDMLEFGESGKIVGQIKVKGLPDIEKTFIDADLEKLYSTFSDAEKINVPANGELIKMNFPTEVKRLHHVDFNGHFIGFVSDFVTYGNIKTALGNVEADVNIKTTGEFQYTGSVATSSFQLGKFLSADPNLGDIAFTLDVNGVGLEKRSLMVSATGNIYSMNVKGYTYRDIAIDGNFSKMIFSGYVGIKDENADLDFNGMVDLNDKLPHISSTCDIRNLHPFRLNLISLDTFGSYKGLISVEMTGNTIRTLNGALRVSGLEYVSRERLIALDSIVLTDRLLKNGHDIQLRSDIVNASIKGKTNIADLPYAFTKIAHNYLPNFVDESSFTEVTDTAQSFKYRIEVDNDKDLLSLLSPKLRLRDPLKVHGSVGTVGNSFVLKVDSTQWSINNVKFNKNVLEVFPSDNDLVVKTSAESLEIGDGFVLENLNLFTVIRHDSAIASVDWFNRTELADSGEVKVTVYRTEDYPWNAILDKMAVRIAGVEWYSRKNATLHADSTSFSVGDLLLESPTGRVKCDGRIGMEEESKLNFDVLNFDLAYLSNFGLLKQKTDGMFVGNVDASYRNKSLFFDGKIRVDSLVVDDIEIGNIDGQANYDTEREAVAIDVGLSYQGNENVQLVGDYFPNRKVEQLDIEAGLVGFRISSIEPFIDQFASELNGNVDGSISITGAINDPQLNGALNLKKFQGKVNYLNTTYKIDNTVIAVTPNAFDIVDAKVVDVKNETALASAHVSHKAFKDFSYSIDINADNFQCLNTTLADNEDYYGIANVTGIVEVSGDSKHTYINVEASTDKGTQLSIPLTSGGDINEFDYIRFVNSSGFKVEHKEDALESELKGLELDFKLAVDEDAEVQIIFDEKVGDVIKVRGNGDMLMQIDNRGKFNIYGDYIIGSGDYLFTLQNVINKRFVVDQGSKLTWNGEVGDAALDIRAIYKLKASPLTMVNAMTAIDASDPSYAVYNQRLPVNVNLFMVGPMSEPEIRFGVKLPTLTESDIANQLLDPGIASQEQITSQAFSLLLANHFSAGNGNVALGGSGQSSGFEVLSNQLSNWASQYSDKFDVGVNYRDSYTDENGETASETELSLSTELFNDRVKVEVNGSGQGKSADADAEEASSLAGEFNVEYKINKDGSLKARVYNEANNYSAANLNQSPYTQGVGLFYRKEFNTWGEFFRGLLGKSKKPKKAAMPVNEDTDEPKLEEELEIED